jgi:hypothetical protein
MLLYPIPCFFGGSDIKSTSVGASIGTYWLFSSPDLREQSLFSRPPLTLCGCVKLNTTVVRCGVRSIQVKTNRSASRLLPAEMRFHSDPGKLTVLQARFTPTAASSGGGGQPPATILTSTESRPAPNLARSSVRRGSATSCILPCRGSACGLSG